MKELKRKKLGKNWHTKPCKTYPRFKVSFWKWIEDSDLTENVAGQPFLPNMTGRIYWSKKDAMKAKGTYKNIYADPKHNTFKLKKLTLIVQ